jgi:tRNA-2-methylthio-N6-dimethylallyladenosine synthase
VEKVSVKQPGELAGRTPCNRWVNFAAPTSLIGRMAPIRITAALTNSLRGEWLAERQAA